MLAPPHTGLDVGVTVIVGKGLTVIVMLALFVQPFVSVPTTVYVFVAVGEKPTPFVIVPEPPDHT